MSGRFAVLWFHIHRHSVVNYMFGIRLVAAMACGITILIFVVESSKLCSIAPSANPPVFMSVHFFPAKQALYAELFVHTIIVSIPISCWQKACFTKAV